MQTKVSKESYSNLVLGGHYEPRDEVAAGRLDHVRRVWENQLTRFYLRPALTRLLEQRGTERLRIVDLGCGTGEGWQLLTRIASSESEKSSLVGPERIQSYLGVDLCAEMLRQGRDRLLEHPQARFLQADLGQPERFIEPADLYFSSYGSPSHLDDDQLQGLLETIGARAPSGAVIVLDLLGQLSLEWPAYWGYSLSPAQPRMQPYNMVWLYPRGQRREKRAEFEQYRLRFWAGEEIEGFARRVLGNRLANVERFDRSIFVGRHLDTADFHPGVRPTRQAVNSLFEFNRHTSPSELLVGAIPSNAHPFLENYRRVWNALVSVFELICRSRQPSDAVLNVCHYLNLPEPLARGVVALAAQAEHGNWLEPGFPIGNSLEPGMGLLLRQSEYYLQRGVGCGHGLMVVLELS